jgi:hypothetical protein
VTGNVTAYSDLTVRVEVAYQYSVKALDARQNRSDASNTAQITVRDTTAPTAPANLVAQANVGTRVDLSWSPSTDNVAVTGYEVYRDGALLATVGNVTAYADMLVAALVPYQYTVRALDARANRSQPSNTATVTPPAVASFAALADARVEENRKNNNFGADTTLSATGDRKHMESYLRFQVAGIGTVKSAKLRLTTTTATADGPAVYPVPSTWLENTVTWSNKPLRGVTPAVRRPRHAW